MMDGTELDSREPDVEDERKGGGMVKVFYASQVKIKSHTSRSPFRQEKDESRQEVAQGEVVGQIVKTEVHD